MILRQLYKERIRSLLLLVAASALAFSGSATARDVPLDPLERQIRDGRVVGSGDASARRVAVVLGVGSYRHTTPLRNPVTDAQAVARLLRQHGFYVIEGYDADKRSIEAMLREAVVAAGRSAESVFFFSGHGIQIADRNYLLPVDVHLADETDVPFQTLALDSIATAFGGASELHLSFLDSCRNNPFEGGTAVSTVRGTAAPIRQGFTQPAPKPGALLAYATQPGAVALDGTGEHSPYTQALISAAGIAPNSDIETLLTAVQRFVESNTSGQQVPVFTSALPRPFVLLPPPPTESVALSTAVETEPQASTAVAAPTAIVTSISAPTAAVPVTGLSRIQSGLSHATASNGGGGLVVPRERVIALGQRLARLLGLAGGDRITFGANPASGSLGLLTRSGEIVPVGARSISSDQLASLVLRVEGASARGIDRTSGVAGDRLQVTVSGARGASRTDVPLSLVPNRCDIEAGDWFDPQGTGIHRLDGALRSGQAIAACQRALTNEPASARFRFQLGRGLKAAGRNAEAESQFLQAAQSGHARAWLAYGEMLLLRGDLRGADGAYQRGHDAGDPQATVALGALRLRAAPDDSGRQAAYELLTTGVDLGLWEAMDVLARYYADPNAPDADMRRAQRFAAEAGSRRNAIPPTSVAVAAPADSGRGGFQNEPNGGGDDSGNDSQGRP